MMTLIWLVHFDERWMCFHCPIIQSMWLFGTCYCIFLSFINLYSIYFQEYCQYAHKHLLINSLLLSILASLSYIIYNKTKIKKTHIQSQIQNHENISQITYQLNNWTIRKVLLSKIGFAVLFFGIIQNIWAINTYLNLNQINECHPLQPTILKINIFFTILASIPIACVIICYILIKTVALMTSSLFPHFYISLKRAGLKK